MALVLLAMAAATAINLPLGMWRATTRRFSWQWFLAIHASIPLVVALRMVMGLQWTMVPLTFMAAVIGQLVGAWLGARVLRRESQLIDHPDRLSV